MKDAKRAAAAGALLLLLVGAGALAATLQDPPAEPAAEAEPAPAGDETAPTVEIAFGTEVDRETRTLVGEAAAFGPDLDRIFCLTRIVGMTPPATVTHAWYYEGKTMARVDLKVGSPDWRTWSSKRYLPAWTGQWEVKVLDTTGRVLASAGFEIRGEVKDEAPAETPAGSPEGDQGGGQDGGRDGNQD